MWKTKVSPQDFLCTTEEFYKYLEIAIKENKTLDNYVKLNKNNLKNSALISSLNNKTSGANKTSRAQVLATERQDKSAVSNLEKIKNNGIVDAKLDQDNVVSVVNEIRTVQSNKNIKKTRKAVIVRNNKEHRARTVLAKTFNLLSFVAVGLVAIFLGVFAGNMYIASKSLVSYDYNEADYLPNYSAVYASNNTTAKDKVSATNAYIMAEYALMQESNLTTNYTLIGSGYVSAKVAGINQKQVVAKKIVKTSELITNESVTNGLIPAAEYMEYNLTTNKLNSYVTTQVEGEPPVAKYDSTPTTSYDLNTQLQDFRNEYGIKPDTVFAQIVSDKTVLSDSYLGSENGEYKYQLTLNNVYSVINYVNLMIHISGLERPPTFKTLTITFTVDENYKFTNLHIYEEYQIYYLGLPADCTAETTYTFSY